METTAFKSNRKKSLTTGAVQWGGIEYFVDRNVKGEIHGFPIYSIDEAPDIEQHYVIVASQSGAYLSIRDELRRCNLEEIKDFIWHGALGKKICYIHANCLGRWIKRYLAGNPAFSAEYAVYPSKEVQFFDFDETLDDGLLKSIDLFIYQRIGTGNRYDANIADKKLLPKLKSECITMVVPNFYPLGYGFYQSQTNDSLSFCGNCIFFFDEWIESRIHMKNAEEIYLSIMGVHVDRDNVISKFEEMMCELRSREKEWDIKIADVIYNNYQRKPIFADIGHPSIYMGEYVMHQIAELLGLKHGGDDCSFMRSFPIGFESFVWEPIKKVLNLDYKQKVYRDDSRQNLKIMDFNIHDAEYMDEVEYIGQYLYVRRGLQ